MNKPSHTSAKPSHYTKQSKSYDAFNEKNSQLINTTLTTILKNHPVKNLLDLTCGTGSQVFWLAQRGYKVVGADINASMLKIARNKARQDNIDVTFLQGDMRTINVGTFDAVITIFNAVGHLTKQDFEQAMQNIHANLRSGGLYIFDIFNLDYLLNGNNITALTIDWQTIDGNTKTREFQYSTIDKEGILASYSTFFEQIDNAAPRCRKNKQTLQVYTAKQLQEMLHRNGFKVLKQCAVDGSPLITTATERMLTVAQKI